MEALQIELRRLGRAFARATGSRHAARLHLGLLVAALAAAFVHRAVVALPGFGWIAGRWIPTVACALGLFLLGPLLARLLARLLQPRPRQLARRLDDRFAWRDETTTAVDLDAEAAARPVPAFLVAQAAGRLHQVDARAFGARARPRRWPRALLVFLFAFVLLAPGVRGLFGPTGGGTDETGGGDAPALQPVGPPRPMRADFWLQSFVESPLPVEPLPPPAADPDAEGPR